MALREVRQMGDPILEKKCKPVKFMMPRLEILIDDMLDTMYEANGVGLAAPQVGVLRQIVVIDIGGTDEPDEDEESGEGEARRKVSELNSRVEFPLVLVNPVILETAGEQCGAEGCLSLPGKVGNVTRPNYVKVKALD
ncbi:MAG: peptide deformylase, partial [Lachnospiraceae bacterium]|nr:peptide deformylase [Lachnospiraceae bacterium]